MSEDHEDQSGEICEAGNRVVFDEEGSHIENKAPKKKTNIEKVKGVYLLRLWVKG